jgi:hypothetical protein
MLESRTRRVRQLDLEASRLGQHGDAPGGIERVLLLVHLAPLAVPLNVGIVSAQMVRNGQGLLEVRFMNCSRMIRSGPEDRIIWHFGHGLHSKRRFSGRLESGIPERGPLDLVPLVA